MVRNALHLLSTAQSVRPCIPLRRACISLCHRHSLGVQELPRAPMSSLTDVFPMQIPWESGYLLPPEGPGLGIEFNEDALTDVSNQEYWTAARLSTR